MRHCLFSLLTACALAGAPTASPAQTAPGAAPVVRLLESKYHNVKTLKAVFLQTYRDEHSGIQMESGTVYFSRPGRMRWEYESPESKLFIADGKSVWFFVPADHTVTRSPMKESDDWRTPLALLTGKARLSQLCARIDLAGTDSLQAGHVTLSCIPRGTKLPKSSAEEGAEEGILTPAPYDRVLLEVDSSSGELADVRVLEAGGVELEFRFGRWQEDIPVQEAFFRFQTPPGVTVVDESAAPR
jgi:outer membrane lipoprotein carrier protein